MEDVEHQPSGPASRVRRKQQQEDHGKLLVLETQVVAAILETVDERHVPFVLNATSGKVDATSPWPFQNLVEDRAWKERAASVLSAVDAASLPPQWTRKGSSMETLVLALRTAATDASALTGKIVARTRECLSGIASSRGFPDSAKRAEYEAGVKKATPCDARLAKVSSQWEPETAPLSALPPTRSCQFPEPSQLLESLKKVIPPLPFGVEIEVSLGMDEKEESMISSHPRKAQELLPSFDGNFRDPSASIRFFDYRDGKRDREYNTWKITTDSSIVPDDGSTSEIYGFEFVSPILHGENGLVQIEDICRGLSTLRKCNANKSTALHVHVSCESLSNEEVRRFSSFSVFYEPVLDQLMEPRMRSDRYDFGRSNLRSVSASSSPQEAARIVELVDVECGLGHLIDAINPLRPEIKKFSRRDHKINFILLKNTQRGSAGRRVEFRQHHGSLDNQTISAWTTLLTVYVDRASRMPEPPYQYDSDDGPSWKHFWKLIDNVDIEDFFTARSQQMGGNR